MPTQEPYTSKLPIRSEEQNLPGAFPRLGVVGLILCIALIALIPTPVNATFCRPDSPDLLENQLADGSIDSLAIASDILEEAMRAVQSLYIDSISAEELLDAAFAGIRERLDPHTKFLPPAEFDRLMSPTTATAGIGVVFDFSNNVPRIKRTFPDGPAQHGGLLPGDRLLAVNDRSIAGVDSTQVYKWLRGEAGTEVSLSIEVPGESTQSITLIRSVVGEQMFSSALLENGTIGYLKIRRFSRGIAADCEQVLRRWSDRDLTGMVIDLRDNPGGFLDEAVRAADLWLPPGRTIVVSEGRAAEESSTEISYRDPLLPMVPVTILIDSLTASSAEIFAGALQGGAAATLVGEASYGKRTVQRIKRLPGGGALKVTSAVFHTPADHQPSVPDQRLRDMATITGMATNRSKKNPVTGRGERLQPDLHLARTNLPTPWNWIEQSGYLARFEHETSYEVTSAAEDWTATYWDREQVDMGLLISRASHNPHSAPGFELWLNQFENRLRQWGVVIDPALAGNGDNGHGLDQLRYRWLADWAREQWGEAAAQITTISTDQWVRAAVAHLQQERNNLPEYSSIHN
jgi:carboxyl-terminal processing protease